MNNSMPTDASQANQWAVLCIAAGSYSIEEMEETPLCVSLNDFPVNYTRMATTGLSPVFAVEIHQN